MFDTFKKKSDFYQFLFGDIEPKMVLRELIEILGRNNFCYL